MSGYDLTDAAADTNTSSSQTSAAWHDARNDAEAAGEISRGSGPGESSPGGVTEAIPLDTLADRGGWYD